MDLAKLVVRLEAQSAQFLTELEKANRRIDRFASQTSKTLQKWQNGLVGAFSARALLQFGNDVLKAQASLGDMAQRVGVSVEQLSRLGFAAEQSGTDLATLEGGLKGLSKTAVEAQKKGEGAADAFEAIGLSATNADGSLKQTDQLLLEIAEAFSQYEDGAAKSALANKLLSKSGSELIPFLNKGAAGIEELMRKADELGVTISGDAANAADEFNNQLARLAAITRGVVGQALGEVLPVLIEWGESAEKSAGGTSRLSTSASVLAGALKTLLSVGQIIGEVFDRVGSTLGAAAAALMAFAQREYRRAFDIIMEANRDHVSSVAEAGANIAGIWTSSGDKIVAAAEATDAKLKKTLSFGGNTDALEEVNINLPRMDVGEMEQLYRELDALTSTANEKALRAYYEQKAALDELAASQRISAEQYAARLEEVNEQLNEATGVTERQNEALARQKKIMEEGEAIWEATRTPLEQYEQSLVKLNLLLQQGAIDQETYGRAVEQAQDKLDEANGKMTDFAEQARRNVQDILGDGLYDAFKGNSGNILDAFKDMLDRMVAQAIAADLAGALLGTGKDGNTGLLGQIFGAIGGGKKGGSGGATSSGIVQGEHDWMDKISGWAGTIFGGSRDRGGRGRAGMAYAIGTGAQPEVYVPDSSGTFYPGGDFGGRGGGVNQYITVAGRADLRTARQMQIEAARQQRTATARLG